MIENHQRNRDAVTALFGMLLFPLAILAVLVVLAGGQAGAERILTVIGGLALFQWSYRWTPILFRWLWPIAGDEPLLKPKPSPESDLA